MAGAKQTLAVAATVIMIALAIKCPLATNALYVLVALIWLIPDRRIERLLREAERKRH